MRFTNNKNSFLIERKSTNSQNGKGCESVTSNLARGERMQQQRKSPLAPNSDAGKSGVQQRVMVPEVKEILGDLQKAAQEQKPKKRPGGGGCGCWDDD